MKKAERLKSKVLEMFEKLKLSSALVVEILKGGENMMITFLALNVVDGLNSLDDFKNKKLRRLVEKELIRMGYGDLVEEANKPK